MAILYPDATLDSMLDVIKTNVTRVDICSTQPTTYAEATSTYTLGNVVVTSTDFTHGAGDVSGRKTTMGAQTGVSVTGTGTAAHLAFTDGVSVLYAVNTMTSQAVTSGNTADIAAVDVFEINDPTAA